MANSNTWKEDCVRWMGEELTGEYKHYCPDWDDLPIDETCSEFGGCTCFTDNPRAMELVRERLLEMHDALDEMFLETEYWDEMDGDIGMAYDD